MMFVPALQRLRIAAGGILMTFAASTVAAQQQDGSSAAAPLQKVDLELVLAADVSGSIDQREAFMQRKGIADAFRSEEVVRAIQTGILGQIAIVYIEWSGAYFTRIIVDWQVVEDAESATAFANALMAAPPYWGQGTSIGETMIIGAFLIESNNFDGNAKTIDISGDGPNNRGRSPALVRQEIVERGITINGLPIITGRYGNGDWGAYYGDIESYYRNCVIAGPRAFVVPAYGFEDFAQAVRQKLVLEIAQANPDSEDGDGPGIVPAAMALQSVPFVNPLLERETPEVDLDNCITGYSRYFGDR